MYGARIGGSLVLLSLLCSGCAWLESRGSHDAGGPECVSLLGAELQRPPVADSDREQLERVDLALNDYIAHLDDPQKLIWVGRMLGSVNRFREAVAIFETGAKQFPEDPRVHRFLGHRYITLRRFPEAVTSLERAARLAEPLPDELEPNTRPGSAALESMKHAVYYHLGLAHYLLGDFAKAEAAYRLCLTNSHNPDSRCSASHWLWMTLMRAGKKDDAKVILDAIPPALEVVEYQAYRNLCRLYRGELDGEAHLATFEKDTVDYASFGYGLANWHLVNGREARANELFREIVAGPRWMAFGSIAAEAELARGKR
jgi:tetratricopeptide (TPR) repeat protein